MRFQLHVVWPRREPENRIWHFYGFMSLGIGWQLVLSNGWNQPAQDFNFRERLFSKVRSVGVFSILGKFVLVSCPYVENILKYFILTRKLVSAWKSPELPTLHDSAESSLKLNQSFHVLLSKVDNRPDYGTYFPIRPNKTNTRLHLFKRTWLRSFSRI